MSAKPEGLEERLLDFAARTIKMGAKLPKSAVGKHISLQVVRSATSSGANYEESRGAESKKDFVHKLGICLKELRETRYWLKIIAKAELAPASRMKGIIQEADELCKIVGKSIVTAKRNISERKQ